MQDSGLSLAEECFREHVASHAFQEGVERGWWGLAEHPAVKWPHVVIWLATPLRNDGPDRFHFRFLLEDYPAQGPTACVWDFGRARIADATARPKGTGDVAKVFRTDWEDGTVLYAPWDRIAADKHPDWPPKHPGMKWKPTDSIVKYLHYTRELLASPEYTG